MNGPPPGPPPLRRSLHDVRARGAVVAIGNFDGVHRGHHALLQRMRDDARTAGRPSLVVTFFPPAKVVFTGAPYLAGEREKHRLLAAYAPDEIVVQPFDAAYAATPPEAFLEALRTLAPATLIVGEDFRFGRDRAGGLEELQHVPDRLEVVRLVHDDDGVISSSRIRAALERGDLATAQALLGGPYLVMGTVVPGDARGRTIGVPTANVAVPDGKALPLGVFAVTVETPAGTFGGMANAGPRPTVGDARATLEVHLFDVDLDLYGADLAVFVHAHLRGQRRFDGLDALKAQLAADADAARHALRARGLPAGDVREA
ncbi:MAG: riboflavin biosynthesis protein RibF [Trueperaceae bacterium]|nr:riboflavin biosynthesis protein RibF [Trueperaceae bacterium]